MLNRHYVFVICLAIIGLLLAGCSSRTSTPVAPLDSPADIVADASSRVLLGAWTMDFDAESMTASVMPERSLLTHYQVKYLIPTPGIVINTIYPNYVIDADVTLTNPYPFDVYDIRLIIYTDDDGHMLENADDWTGLYDIPGGEDINPFKAYAKHLGYRKFAGETNHTENLLVFNPPGSYPVQFAVDASYPGNCEEPYLIENFTQGEIYESVGSHTQVTVDVYDWQDDVSEVFLQCPAITSEPESHFEIVTSTEWELELVNNAGASHGVYPACMIARSANSASLALYDRVEIIVSAGAPALFEWVRTWGGIDEDRVYSVAVDDSGYVYATGYFKEEVDFGDGIPIQSNGRSDAYLVKHNSNGDLIWVKTWGGNMSDSGKSVAVDNSGNVYITGSFQAEVDFGDGNPIPSNGFYDAFLIKHDSNGNLICVKTWGGDESDSGYSVAVDNTGNIYVTGKFEDEVDFGDGNPIQANGDYDAYIVKYDSNGDSLWVKTWGGIQDDHGNSLAVDNDGNVYVTGMFEDEVDFGDGKPIQSYGDGWGDAYLVKCNSNGDLIWVKTRVGFWMDIGISVAVDDFGNVYVVGLYSSSLVNNHKTFLIKYNSSGDFVWVKTWGGIYDTISEATGYSLAIDAFGNIFVTGKFRGEVDFGDGNPIHSIGCCMNAYFVKYNSNGNLIWVITWGGMYDISAKSVAVDNFGNKYVTGFFDGEVDFGDGNPTHSNGDSDAYLLKFSIE